jgi:hypothetical protein
MERDREDRPERVRLTEAEDDYYTRRPGEFRAARYREYGVRRSRQVSNWTAAVLVAGAAAASGYFAHAAATPVVAGTTQPGTTVSGSAAPGSAASGTAGQKATVAHPVVTSGGSGVIVGQNGHNGSNGQVVAYRDN